jgi:seryl-tRNA synthetase
MKVKEVLEKHQRELERIGVEEKSLGGLEVSYKTILKNAEDMKRKNSTIGNKLLALVKGEQVEKKIAAQDRIIGDMRKGLQQIEKRRNEIAKILQKKEVENAQLAANVRKVMANVERERTEVRRQQQREWDMQEKLNRTGTDFGATRLIKRRKR